MLQGDHSKSLKWVLGCLWCTADWCKLCLRNLRSVWLAGVASGAQGQAAAWEIIALLELNEAKDTWVFAMIRCEPCVREYGRGATFDSAQENQQRRWGDLGRKKPEVESKILRGYRWSREPSASTEIHSFMSGKLKEQSALMGISKEPEKASQRVRSWSMWLSWLGMIPQSKSVPVQFLIRAHAWVVGLFPSWGVWERQPINVSLTHWRFSPLFLPPFLCLY